MTFHVLRINDLTRVQENIAWKREMRSNCSTQMEIPRNKPDSQTNASIGNFRVKNVFKQPLICNSDSPLLVVVHFGLHSHNISLKTTKMLLVSGRGREYGTMQTADERNGSLQSTRRREQNVNVTKRLASLPLRN